MLDIGWSEMAVIALVALVVIGPKDLPKVMRTVGQWLRKARSVSREFQSSIDEMIREAELDDAKKAIQSTRNLNVDRMLDETIDPTGDLKNEVRAIDDEARDRGGKTSDKPPTSATSAKSVNKAVEAKSDEGSASETTPDNSTPEAAAGATVIKHPAQPAPPHSLTPPKESAGNGAAPPATESASATDERPNGDIGRQKSGQKSA